MRSCMATNEFATNKLSLLSAEVSLSPEQVDAAWQQVRSRAAAMPPARNIRARWVVGLGVAAALTLVLLIPTTRAVAQSVWRSLVLWRAEPLSLDMAATSMELLMPNVFPRHQYGESWRTPDLAEAERIAGFHVMTLASPRLPYPPSFRIEQQPDIARVVDLSMIRTELARLGRPMVHEPGGIDGREDRPPAPEPPRRGFVWGMPADQGHVARLCVSRASPAEGFGPSAKRARGNVREILVGIGRLVLGTGTRTAGVNQRRRSGHLPAE